MAKIKDLFLGFKIKKADNAKKFPFPKGLLLANNISEFEKSPTQEVSEEKDRDNAPKQLSSQIETLTFKKTQEGFFDQMLAFLDVMPMSHFASEFGKGILVENFRNRASELVGNKPKEADGWEIYKLPEASQIRAVREAQNLTRKLDSMRVIPNIFLMGLVSQYDAFLGSLIRTLAEEKPHIILGSNKTFSATEVFLYTDVETFKEAVLEKEIETVLRLSHEDQFEWLEKKIDCPLTKNLESWGQFIEICERRNLFAHTNGRVSAHYILKCEQADFKSEFHVGQKIQADPDYLSLATATVLEVGIKLAQVLWRKSLDEDDEHKAANSSLNNIAFTLIQHEHFQLAERLLKFGLSKPMKHPDGVTKHMMIINLANAQMLLDNKEDAIATLKAVDWAPYSRNFQLCVAAVRGEIRAVCENIKLISEKEMDMEDYFEWPVFKSIRDNKEFITALTQKFGASRLEPYLSTYSIIVGEELSEKIEEGNKITRH